VWWLKCLFLKKTETHVFKECNLTFFRQGLQIYAEGEREKAVLPFFLRVCTNSLYNFSPSVLWLLTVYSLWMRCCTFRSVRLSDVALDRFCGMTVGSTPWSILDPLILKTYFLFCWSCFCDFALQDHRGSNLKGISHWQINVFLSGDTS